ncbi:MAG: hypothetical protein GW892_34885, partial [Armatimonadetes bacterium]|nr:hypothetical protein [Armatimonadota bacterium]
MSAHKRKRTGDLLGRGAVAAALLLASLAASADVLQYGDGNADGKKSLAGRGHLILFDAGK